MPASPSVVHEGGFTLKRSMNGTVVFLDRDGWEVRVAPQPRIDLADPLAPTTERLAAQDIVITARTLPTWEGGPFNLGYAVDALYVPPARIPAT